jgi:hypothetical protein
MAVTDLTDLLPYWARGGQGGPSGPGPSGTAGAAPMGSGGLPGAGNSASWLDYLSQMFGVSPAQAGEAPDPLAVLRAGGTPPVNNTLDASVVPPANAPVPPPPPAATGPQPDLFPRTGGWAARPAGVSASGLPLSPGSENNASLAQFGPNASAPWPSGGGSVNPNAPVTAARPASAVHPAVAAAAAAAQNPRFVQIDRPNMDPAGGARWQGSPQMTALNLAGLFGGGANPANVPSAAAQPVSATRRVPGPLAKTGYNIPGSGYTLTPQGDVTGTRWPQMSPDQLKAAVHKPNWYRNV